jgi:transcriptional regulator with XRE-family HTH domain
MTHPANTVNLARLCQWIDAYINLPGTTETWSGLFRRAGISPGTQAKLRKADPKYIPDIRTIHAIADAMGRDRTEALTIAGYISQSDEIPQTGDYHLLPDEKLLIDNYRVIRLRDQQTRQNYAQMVLDMASRMAAAGGMQ